MAPNKRSGKKASSNSTTKKTAKPDRSSPPEPFKKPPEALAAFISGLEQEHVYILHVDSKPADFKRKIFLVPVCMNIGTIILLLLRLYYILPWYWRLLELGFGHHNEMTVATADSTWGRLVSIILQRTGTMIIDFVLFIYIGSWPVDFFIGQQSGNPTSWRWQVGFRPEEIYVRRSRAWAQSLGNLFDDQSSMLNFVTSIEQATRPIVQEQKTGYLLMNKQWTLDWDAMVEAHGMVDKKEVPLGAFRNVVLVYQQDFGWLSYDLGTGVNADEDARRRHLFAFRDALKGMGKEDLFYRWVEIVQFEASRPGGFDVDKQQAAATEIRELFEAEGVDFDSLWQKVAGDAPQEL